MSEAKGHISKEKWVEQGRDPEQWRSKEQWEEKGEQLLPIVKKNLAEMKEEVGGLKGQLKESRQAFAEFTEFQNKARQADAKKAYQQALRDIQKQQREAVGEMDQDKYDSLEDQKGDLYRQYVKETAPPEVKTTETKTAEKPTIPEEEQKRASEFIKANSWFDTDPVMTAYAKAQSFSLMDTEGNINYEQLEKDIKTRFPEKFTNPRRDDVSSVEGSETKTASKGKKTFEDLPESAKKAYAKFHKNMPDFTKDQYLADYQWD